MNCKFHVILALSLFFTSCQDVRKPEIPANLLDKQTMVNVLSESYLMNAARSVANREIVKKGIKLDSIIYAKYAIDSLQFAESNAYYSADLDLYKGILLEIQQNLINEKELRDTLYSKYKITQEGIRVKDSIEKAQLDSLRIEYPKISKDSLQSHLVLLQLLEVELQEKKTEGAENGIDLEPAESDQDSLK